MKIINSSVEIIPQEPGLKGVYKQIEIAGRTSYKSENRITEDSADKFVNMLIERGHTAPLEQGTIYLYFPWVSHEEKYENNPYSKVTIIRGLGEPLGYGNGGVYITTNARVIQQNGWQDDLQYICKPCKYHEKRITVRFTCSRSISLELIRHRAFSFVQESQRYCNYTKEDKFGSEITFIKPFWYKEDGTDELFIDSCKGAERCYFTLISEGCTPQEAREVLPNSCKTEVVMTGFVSDWIEFFKLRCDKSAHPDMQKLANSLKLEFIHNGYIQ